MAKNHKSQYPEQNFMGLRHSPKPWGAAHDTSKSIRCKPGDGLRVASCGGSEPISDIPATRNLSEHPFRSDASDGLRAARDLKPGYVPSQPPQPATRNPPPAFYFVFA